MNAARALNKSYGSEEAIKLFGSKLSEFEKSEIQNYQRIYFAGPESEKHIGSSENNDGFDDSNGHYIFNTHDHIGYRYEILEPLGKGSFGQVIKAYDHKCGKKVALKIIRNSRHFFQQAQKEVTILDKLRRADSDGSGSVIHMLEHFTFRNHKCIVFELLAESLYELIKKQKFEGFPIHLVRKFVHSIILCLELLHRNNIIHSDLKPENILLYSSNRCCLKVIDFGSACFENEQIYSYIQTRFYRAPEVILGCGYGKAIDMWSLGCIVAELLVGYPLFPGGDADDQLALYIELVGLPPSEVMKKARYVKKYFSSEGQPLYWKTGKRGAPGTRGWTSALKNKADNFVLDFIQQCLQWDPALRLSALDARKHPWMKR
uniref:Dual-specificity kinase n=1 Tax=Panagrolaimus sp. ES5 TaxID=591445 RepID=A0AC34FA27_9BILA